MASLTRYQISVIFAPFFRTDKLCRCSHNTMWFLLVIVIILSSSLSSQGFNLDVGAPTQFSMPSTTYFGYSVLLHENRREKCLLVGAPRSNSDVQPGINRPGALYKCNLVPPSGQRCTQVILDREGNERSAPGERPLVLDSKDDQWLGVSLTRLPGINGKVATCGHLWANDYYSDAILPNGVCYTINSNLDYSSVIKDRPCLDEIQIKADSNGKGIAWHGWCQAGFSAEYALDGSSLLLGAVGSIAWRGTVISMTESGRSVADTSTWFPVGDEDESYVGYSVSSGYFTSLSEVQGVTGAPRAYEHGRVYIYNLRDFTLYTEIHGPGMSTYFGARVLGMNLNGDDWTDLLVGAPLYAEDQDEGCVYIYRNEGVGVMLSEGQLKGSRIPKSRFGSSIENVGDLNMDGFEDVAIGAPYEENGSGNEMTGAVYIYHGTGNGLKTSFSQRITPSSFGAVLQSFGHSISGKLDVDGNGYPDLAVGAYQSGKAVVFLSRPVIEMETRLDFSRAPIDIKQADCLMGDKKVPCVQAFTCFRYRGHAVPPTIPIDYTIETDWYKSEKGVPTRLQFVDKGTRRSVREGTLQLEATIQKCVVAEAHIDTDVKDFLSPIPFKVNYTLRTSHTVRGLPQLSCDDLCPIFDMYSGNNIVELISFIHNCGNDSMCETDLQLKVDTHIPRGTSYLPVGVEDHFFINVEVYNNGEEAHQAKVKIGHSDEISFVNVRSNPNREALVICSPEKSENETYIMCYVDNPMPPFSTSKFTVKVGIRTIHPDTEFLSVYVEAMTSSMEHNNTLDDNTHVQVIPTKIEADLLVRGVARPENIIYDTLKEIDLTDESIIPTIPGDAMGDTSVGNATLPVAEINMVDPSKIGPVFQHVYDVRNIGPSSLPLLTTVNISFPWKTKEGKMLTYIADVRINGLGSCYHNHSIEDKQTELLDFKVWNASMQPRDPQSSPQSRNPYSHSLERLSCDTVECVNIVCTVGTLPMGSGVVIEIEARLWTPTFTEVWSENTGLLALESNAKLTVRNPTGRHIQPNEHRPDFDKVSTMLYTEAAVKPKSVSKWLIALGIICGIACLLLLVFIMYKLGFFKRPMREEMERLIQEKDEIENLNPDGFGDMNGFDQEVY